MIICPTKYETKRNNSNQDKEKKLKKKIEKRASKFQQWRQINANSPLKNYKLKNLFLKKKLYTFNTNSKLQFLHSLN